jgi:molecular chaperone DnaK
VHATRSSLKEMGEKIGEDDRKNIESAMEGVEEAMKGDDKDVIDSAVNNLSEAAQVIFQQAQAEAQAEQASESPAGAEDVVDAEFEEVDEEKKDD